MKKILISAIFLLLYSSTQAQDKHGNVWVLGYGDTFLLGGVLPLGGMTMDFNTEPPTILKHSFLSGFPLACISDQNGKLLAYTSGCSVFNRKHQEMLNGDTLNPGTSYNDFCNDISPEYLLWQGSIFLPLPGHGDQYYLMHLARDDEFGSPHRLYYTLIDTSLDKGLGGVVSKNNLVFQDSFLNNYVTATRHANGRDWWIIAMRNYRPHHYVWLLDPDGFHFQGLQEIGAYSLHGLEAQVAFSADGSKFIKNWPSGLFIYDFDRCTGLLSNPVNISYDSTYDASGGVVTSANSRFLYLFGITKVWQYDFWATDFKASRQTVAVYDGFVSPNPTGFFQAMLAPNGKIYSVSTSTNNVLHVIHHPEEPGLACDVEQHGVILPTLTGFLIPNMPNYRLGPLAGSPCDSLTVSAAEPQPHWYEPAGLDVYPNPATEEVNFEQLSAYAGLGGHLTLSDVAGRVVASADFQPGEPVLHLDVRGLASGMYVWSYVRADGRRATGKIVKSEK